MRKVRFGLACVSAGGAARQLVEHPSAGQAVRFSKRTGMKPAELQRLLVLVFEEGERRTRRAQS